MPGTQPPPSQPPRRSSTQPFDPASGRIGNTYNPNTARGPPRTGTWPTTAANAQNAQAVEAARIQHIRQLRAAELERQQQAQIAATNRADLLRKYKAFQLIRAKTNPDKRYDGIRNHPGFQNFDFAGLPTGISVGGLGRALAGNLHNKPAPYGLPMKAREWTWDELAEDLEASAYEGFKNAVRSC